MRLSDVWYGPFAYRVPACNKEMREFYCSMFWRVWDMLPMKCYSTERSIREASGEIDRILMGVQGPSV